MPSRLGRPTALRRPGADLIGLAVLALIFVAGLSWAKWLPYWDRAWSLQAIPVWPSGDIFEAAGAVPSLGGAWDFTVAYVGAVWKAVVVAMLVAAAIDALLPRALLLRMMNRRSPVQQALVGGAASLPSMMCSCCAAPVAVGLRRSGVSTGAVLAYWVGNPLLNPAVIVFLALVLPWEFAATRLLIGALIVVGASALIGRLVSRSSEAAPAKPVAEPSVRQLPRRFFVSLSRFVLVLVPEYLALVFLMGLVSPWLSNFDSFDASFATLLVAVAAGTLLVIPTGGEIPVVAALLSVGVGAGIAGALLLTLPALSVPSLVMVGQALGWRATTAMAAAVATGGVLAAVLLTVLV